MAAFFAEREGFEPPVPLGTPVFKTGVIDHSTISPEDLSPLFQGERILKSGAKVRKKVKSEKRKVKKYMLHPKFFSFHPPFRSLYALLPPL